MESRTFTNVELGVASRVVVRPDGRVAVELYDLDADARLPFIRTYPADRAEDAIAYAQRLVGAAAGAVGGQA